MKVVVGLILFGVAAVVIGGVALLALGGSNSDENSFGSGPATEVPPSGIPATELTAQDVLERSAAAAAAVESFHFVLTHENGTTLLPLNLGLDSAEGDVLVPAGLSAEVEADAVGIDVSVRIIGIDDRTWVTNPFTRQWQELPGTNIRDFADPAALVSGLLPAVVDPEMFDGGTVGGAETHLIRGRIDSAALGQALGIAEPGRDIAVEAWIGSVDFLPRKIRLIGALSDTESPDVVRQVVISRFDEPVEIMPPE